MLDYDVINESTDVSDVKDAFQSSRNGRIFELHTLKLWKSLFGKQTPHSRNSFNISILPPEIASANALS